MKTMFFKAKHKDIEKAVSLKDVKSARKSTNKLSKMFNRSRKPKKLAIARATMLAGNRASAMTKKRFLSGKERKELKQVALLYKQKAKRLFKKYRGD